LSSKLSPYNFTGMITLVATFFLMCMVQMWYTMFLLFIMAFVIVLLQGKNSYCAHWCPLGTLQDTMGKKVPPIKKFRGIKLIKYILIPLFWAATLYTTFLYKSQPTMLWVWMLRIMVSMFFIAMVAQDYLGKRFFCVHLCPLRHPILNPLRKARKCAINGCKKPSQ
jgi:polyferredoxin